MFAQVIADFDERTREVDRYFDLLFALDNDEVYVVEGAGPQVVPVGPAPSDWHSMLKGAAYLVIYNLVEAFVRRGFQAVFEAIKTDRLSAMELSVTLRSQWIAQKNRAIKTLDGSPKKYMEIAVRLVEEIVRSRVAELHSDQLPISGNIDAEIVREVCRRHGIDYKTPNSATNGSELTLVKMKRNSLAHGDESFAEVGRQRSATELRRIKDEVVMFMREILGNLESFITNREYRSGVYVG